MGTYKRYHYRRTVVNRYIVVYYESIKWELKIRPTWVSVWWKTKNWNWGINTSHIHCVPRGTGTPEGKDEVNRRDVYKYDGWVCVVEVTGDPSKLSVIRKSAVLERVRTTLRFELRKLNSWTCKKTVSFPMVLQPHLDMVTQFLPALITPCTRRDRVRQILSDVKRFQCGEWKGLWETSLCFVRKETDTKTKCNHNRSKDDTSIRSRVAYSDYNIWHPSQLIILSLPSRWG